MTIPQELQETVASLAKTDRHALAQMIVEWAKPGHIATDYISMLLNTRALQPGDILTKKVRKGIKVATFVPGTVPLAHQMTVSEIANYVLDYAVTRVTGSDWDLRNGNIGTVAEIRNEMTLKMRDYLQNKVFTALSTVWSPVNTPSNYINVGGAITGSVLETAIDTVIKTTGGVKAVVGIRELMTPITKFGAFWGDGAVTPTIEAIPEQLTKALNDGFLGKYYGANLIALRQEYDAPDTYTAMLPTDKILVIGENVGEFITYGAPMTKEYVDPHPTPSQWVMELAQGFGMIIDRVEGIYVIDGVTSAV